eukprot:scaffold3181_cov136-Skeletonema_marinoi.AAC.3
MNSAADGRQQCGKTGGKRLEKIVTSEIPRVMSGASLVERSSASQHAMWQVDRFASFKRHYRTIHFMSLHHSVATGTTYHIGSTNPPLLSAVT